MCVKEHKPPLDSDPSMDLIYVIGDPEGQVDLLAKMLQKIQHNPSKLPFAKNDKIVIIGNYIHPKGESGKDMVDLIRSTNEQLKGQVVILQGRNEHRMLKNRSNFHTSDLGKNFINSYRVPATQLGYLTNKKELACSLLVDDLKWLAKNSIKFYETNKYFVCSSGIDPTKDTLDNQNVNALMYIGNRFIDCKKNYGKIIVHGTVLNNKVEVKTNRINVNTNASNTGLLSCVVLNDKKGTVEEVITVKATA